VDLSRNSQHTYFPMYQKVLLRWRYFFPVFIGALLFAPTTRDIVFGVITDAFFQVGVFVLATLSLYHAVTDLCSRLSFISFPKSRSLTIIFAAVLGALPGCGGAIIVITQFIQGKFSFGAVVAVLTATMGDAAFLLIAAKPLDAMHMIIVCLSVGSITGYLVDLAFGDKYLRQEGETAIKKSAVVKGHSIAVATTLWKIFLLPALLVSTLISFQIEPNAWLGLPDYSVELFGGIFAMFGILLWAKDKTAQKSQYQELVAEDDKNTESHWFGRAVQDTNFVLTWAIAAFILFELMVHWSGVQLNLWFQHLGAFAPLMGIIVGLLPGCGPQIVVTSLYIQGAIPFSAQLGNAISNDGDALFPAIALAPKVAIYATLFSTIPALFVAYGYFWLFE